MEEATTAARLAQAIEIRDKVASGIPPHEWMKQQALVLMHTGFWSDPQIGAICRYDRTNVWRLRRRAGLPPAQTRGLGGSLAPGALDLILELHNAVQRGEKPNRLLLESLIATGTGTRLVSRLTGISLGTILHVQRTLKKAGLE